MLTQIYRSLWVAACFSALGLPDPGMAQSIPDAAAPDRFSYVVTNPTLTKGIRLRDGRFAPVKLFIVTFTADCGDAHLLQLGESGDFVASILNTNPLSVVRSHKSATASPSSVNEDELRKVESLLKQLPDGESNPPFERRLVLRWRDGDDWDGRTYDRAALPREVAGLLRIAGVEPASFGAWVLPFKPERIESVGDSTPASSLAVSPDGKLIVWINNGAKFKVLNPRLQTIAMHSSSPDLSDIGQCSFSGDARYFAIHRDVVNRIDVFDTHDFSRIFKIEPGRHVRKFAFFGPGYGILVRDELGLSCKDAVTGEVLPAPSALPPTSVWWQIAPDERRSVVVQNDNSIWLWDRAKNAPVIRLAKNAVLSASSFSPDNRLLAAFTAQQQTRASSNANVELRISNAATGALQSKLAPYDVAWRVPPMSASLNWTPDGKFLVAASNPDAFGKGCRIHLWHAASGRHVADFVGPSRINGVGLAEEGRVLIAGCATGRIFLWDFSAAIDAIANLDRPDVE